METQLGLGGWRFHALVCLLPYVSFLLQIVDFNMTAVHISRFLCTFAAGYGYSRNDNW